MPRYPESQYTTSLLFTGCCSSNRKSTFSFPPLLTKNIDRTRGYELAFGHHHLEAARQLFWKNYDVTVQLEDYDDAQMLIALADENAERRCVSGPAGKAVVMIQTRACTS